MTLVLHDVPVLLLVFNREAQTRGLVDNLRKVKPGRIFVSADGPRRDRIDDDAKVAATRAVVDEIDWDCEVLRRFSNDNEGCRYGPTHGIDWFFSHVEAGIILEDDIRFDASFFQLAVELLERYREHDQVHCICGYNFLETPVCPGSYRFSRIPLTWGWATWKDRWVAGQAVLGGLSRELGDLDLSWLPSAHDRRDIKRKLRLAHQEDHVWDFLWMYAMWRQGGLAILPSRRITGNQGVGDDATHTKTATDFIHSSYETIKFPLNHPTEIAAGVSFDQEVFQVLLHTPSFGERLGAFMRHPDKLHKLAEMGRVRWAPKRHSFLNCDSSSADKVSHSADKVSHSADKVSHSAVDPSKPLRILVFRPGCSRRRTVFENQLLIYDYLQKEFGYHFHLVVDEDSFEPDDRFEWTTLARKDWQSFRGRHLYPAMRQKVRKIVRLAEGYDVILTVDPVVYPQSMLAFKAAGRLQIPIHVVATITLLTEEMNSRWYSTKFRLLRRLLDQAAGILVPTPKVVERFAHLKLLSNPLLGKIHLVGHPVDLQHFVPAAERRVPGRLISMSRLIPGKGIAYILEAFAAIATLQPHIELIFIGDGPMAEWIRSRSERFGLGGRVRIEPPVGHRDLPALLQTGDVFVSHALSLPSWEEYFGVANLEAMACGLPVVSTASGGISFALQPPSTYTKVGERDITGLAAAMMEAISLDETSRACIVLENRRFVESMWSPERIAGDFQRALGNGEPNTQQR